MFHWKTVNRCICCFGIFAVTSFLAAGCSDKKDDAGITPPPAPSQPAQVDLTQKTPDVLPPGASQTNAGTPAETQAATLPPPTTDEGLAAITKGMTPAEVEKFKETATFENFDTNIQLIQEAANSFYNEFQRRAPTVDALVVAGYLSRKPIAPKGKKYAIDPDTGEVTSQDVTSATPQ